MARIVVTGACGFIGTCLSLRLLERGDEVVGIDNLSRPGAELNARELARPGFTLHRLDLAHPVKSFELFARLGPVDAVFHLAGQVAVTTSYADPAADFYDNAAASFHVIEAVRRFCPGAYCLFASTNKVYGRLRADHPVGVDQPLDPYTPYGVSKTVGELYFAEYGRAEIGLTTCCLRQSCIYGHHQFGVEDQGWMAWFAIANRLGLPVTLYGDGRQTRDLLFVDDLVDLYVECFEKRVRGVWPVGGGVANALTLEQGLALIEELSGRPFVQIRRAPARPGDQPYFVADLSWRERAGVTWAPRVGVRQGVAAMLEWIERHRDRIAALRMR